jgi:hypothetical protein
MNPQLNLFLVDKLSPEFPGGTHGFFLVFFVRGPGTAQPRQ